MCKKMNQAVRAFNRLFGPKAKMMSRQHDCDREYDAGEWSDRFHADNFERVFKRDIKTVADHFGFEPVDLEIAIEEQHHIEMDYYLEACSNSSSTDIYSNVYV